MTGKWDLHCGVAQCRTPPCCVMPRRGSSEIARLAIRRNVILAAHDLANKVRCGEAEPPWSVHKLTVLVCLSDDLTVVPWCEASATRFCCVGCAASSTLSLAEVQSQFRQLLQARARPLRRSARCASRFVQLTQAREWRHRSSRPPIPRRIVERRRGI